MLELWEEASGLSPQGTHGRIDGSLDSWQVSCLQSCCIPFRVDAVAAPRAAGNLLDLGYADWHLQAPNHEPRGQHQL